jgi:UDP-glucose 4-epimerase
MKALVTGVAGYIGSVVAEQLLAAGHDIVGLDSLRAGRMKAVPDGVQFVQADLQDQDALRSLFRNHPIYVVLHLAADSIVPASVKNPGATFRNNVVGSLNLLQCMVEADVKRIIFSSTASVYGNPDSTPITEDSPTVPVNPYGESKLMVERMLRWFHQAHGLNSVSLRYFNAAGATQRLGEDHRPETHLIPTLLNAVLHDSGPLPIFGTHYPTKDGTAVRDYVHVSDIATAHLLAMERVDSLGYQAYNLGSAHGYSVQEVVAIVERVTGKRLATETADPRPGDPATLVASNELAQTELGWRPRYTLDEIIGSAWRWQQEHPGGYDPS